MVLFGLDKVTKYDMDEPLGSVMFVWIMNKNTYAAMSPSRRKVIDDHCAGGSNSDLALRLPSDM